MVYNKIDNDRLSERSFYFDDEDENEGDARETRLTAFLQWFPSMILVCILTFIFYSSSSSLMKYFTSSFTCFSTFVLPPAIVGGFFMHDDADD